MIIGNILNRYVATTLALTGVGAALITLDLTGKINARAQFSFVTAPAWRITALAWELDRGRDERAALAERCARRSLLLGQAENYKKENDALRARFGLTLKVPYELTYAPVVERRPESWLKAVIIGAGARDGVAPGMAVIGTDGLLGKVVRVTAAAAEVELITSERTRIAVTHAASGEESVYYADAAGVGHLQYLPRTTPLASGDVITTSPVSGNFPPGLIVGHVRSFRRPFDSMFVDAAVAPAQNLNALADVFVVRTVPPARRPRPAGAAGK